MKWIKVDKKSDMPMDGTVFLSLWKGRISITSFDEDEGRFYIMFDPSEYSQSMEVPSHRQNKFTHWMPLPDKPEDYGTDKNASVGRCCWDNVQFLGHLKDDECYYYEDKPKQTS